MFCQHCGAEIEANAPICLKCGCLNAEQSVAKTEKNTSTTGLITLLLLILLGAMGAHRFYLRKIASAVAMLLLFVFGYVGLVITLVLITEPSVEIPKFTLCFPLALWLSWLVWWVIDLVKICTGRFTDADGNAIKL